MPIAITADGKASRRTALYFSKQHFGHVFSF